MNFDNGNLHVTKFATDGAGKLTELYLNNKQVKLNGETQPVSATVNIYAWGDNIDGAEWFTTTLNAGTVTAYSLADHLMTGSILAAQSATHVLETTNYYWLVDGTAYDENLDEVSDPEGTASVGTGIGDVYIATASDTYLVTSHWYTETGDGWYCVDGLTANGLTLGDEVDEADMIAELEAHKTAGDFRTVDYTPYEVAEHLNVDDTAFARYGDMDGTVTFAGDVTYNY